MSDCRSTVFLPESGCSDCSAFESRLSSLEEMVTNLDSQVSALQTSMNAEINGLKETDTALNDRLSDFEVRLSAVEEAIESLIGVEKIPLSITDSNENTVNVNVLGFVS